MRSFFRIVLGALAMMSVALVAALATMRLAIHGTEVAVPNLAGLTLPEARDRTVSKRLNLSLENSFYSTTVPAGRVLAQSPAPGTKVRHQWNVRITESLGPQQVDIPNVVGLPERAATINIRHLGLELGVVAQMSARAGTAADTVLAQSPPANAAGIDRPRVSLLVTQPEPPPAEFVMPDLVRMSYGQAFQVLANAGLRVASLEDAYIAVPAVAPPAAIAAPAATVKAAPPAAIAAIQPPPALTVASGTVVAQSPASGHRVTTADAIHLTVAR